MKKINLMILASATLLCIAGCKKDKVEPSFVNDYNAPLTEEKGVKYTGDYFPLEEGFYWNYSGNQQIIGEAKYYGGGYDETEPLNETGSLYSYLAVKPLETINLSSGTYSLYPVQESYVETGYELRYFEKTDTAIYFRAYGFDGSINEVNNPIFLKNPLVVGDSWIAQPSADLNTALAEDSDLGIDGEIKANITCKMYVIGSKDTIWNGQNISPIRLDELAEAQISIPVNEEDFTGKIDMDLKMTNILYLLENTGIVLQKMQMIIDIYAQATADGESFKMSLNAEYNGDLNLDSYNVSGPTKNTIKITDNEGIKLNNAKNPIYQKTLDKSMKVLKTVKNVITF